MSADDIHCCKGWAQTYTAQSIANFRQFNKGQNQNSPQVQDVSVATRKASCHCLEPQRSWKHCWCGATVLHLDRLLHIPPPPCYINTNGTRVIEHDHIIENCLNEHETCQTCSRSHVCCRRSWTELTCCQDSPVLEGIVHNGLKHQAITNMRRAPEVEHVYGPQSRMGITQTARPRDRKQWKKGLLSESHCICIHTHIFTYTRGVTIYRGTMYRNTTFYNMYLRVMEIFVQYDVHLILLVELPARKLLIAPASCVHSLHSQKSLEFW